MIVDFESYRIIGARLYCTTCTTEAELVSATGKTLAELMAVSVLHHAHHHDGTARPPAGPPPIDPLLRNVLAGSRWPARHPHR